jgi:plasmid maintenance system antidote protein VapI
MSDRSAFERDWRVSPGETVRAIMASRDMLDGDVSAQLDLTLEGFADLICGRIAIDLDLADRLAEVLGSRDPRERNIERSGDETSVNLRSPSE